MSVAEARRRFRELLDRLAEGDVIEIARRGKPAAVLLAPREYRRLVGEEGAFLAGAVSAFRHSVDDQDLLDEALDDLGDPAPGRGVAF